MAEITRILAANICKQFFFVITTTASTRFLVENFQLSCYSQRVNATSQYKDSGSSRCSTWLNDRMVPVVKHCWLFVQGKEAAEKDNQRLLLDRCSRKILACSVSRTVMVIVCFSGFCLKDQLGLCPLKCDEKKLFCELASTCQLAANGFCEERKSALRVAVSSPAE